MQRMNKRMVVFVILSLIVLILLFILFVLPENVIPERSYRGPGGPFLNPPAG